MKAFALKTLAVAGVFTLAALCGAAPRAEAADIGVLPGMFEASLQTHFYTSGNAFSTPFE